MTFRYFGLENNFVMAALWTALVKGEGERRQLQLHCATCFDFNRKHSSDTINVLIGKNTWARHVEMSGG